MFKLKIIKAQKLCRNIISPNKNIFQTFIQILLLLLLLPLWLPKAKLSTFTKKNELSFINLFFHWVCSFFYNWNIQQWMIKMQNDHDFPPFSSLCFSSLWSISLWELLFPPSVSTLQWNLGGGGLKLRLFLIIEIPYLFLNKIIYEFILQTLFYV